MATTTIGKNKDGSYTVTTPSGSSRVSGNTVTTISGSGAYGSTTPQPSSPTPTPTTTSTNPAITSTHTRSGYDALGNEITSKLKDTTSQYDSEAYRDASAEIQKSLDKRMKDLERIYQGEVSGIKGAYDEASLIQGKRQEKDYAGRATGLITAGGGFLGATQSQQGVLQNLTETFQQEKNALMAKRDAALQEASNAFAENSFNIAQLKLKEAKDTEQELYNRQQDFNAQQLDLAKENRAQTEFEYGITDKRAEAYSNMTDQDYAQIPQSEKDAIDKMYFSGFLDSKREIDKKARDIKDLKDALAIDIDILQARKLIPLGQKFQLAGKTYTGLGEVKTTDKSEFKKENEIKFLREGLFTPKINEQGQRVAPVIEGTSIPFVDINGFLTPEGFREAMKITPLPRKDFIEEFFNPTWIYNFQDIDDELLRNDYGITQKDISDLKNK
jgi:hypothetical protein